MLRISFFLLLTTFSLAAQSQGMTKDAWTDYMAKAVSVPNCTDKKFFRQCYSVTKNECTSTISSAIKACVSAQTGFPNVISSKAEHEKWTPIIGACMGNKYTETFISKFNNKEECLDASNWK